MAHNPRLADKQGVDEFERKIIDKLHILRYLIEDNVNVLITKYNKKKRVKDKESLERIIKNNYEEWIENERILQKLWKFEENDNFIKFWTFPACSCPRMDNDDNYPTGHYYKVQNCMIHGWDESISK
jgi:hypothetical protein